jgi:hypothetical protein
LQASAAGFWLYVVLCVCNTSIAADVFRVLHAIRWMCCTFSRSLASRRHYAALLCSASAVPQHLHVQQVSSIDPYLCVHAQTLAGMQHCATCCCCDCSSCCDIGGGNLLLQMHASAASTHPHIVQDEPCCAAALCSCIDKSLCVLLLFIRVV